MTPPNPHLHNLERAPYELGHLLCKLPYDVSNRAMSTDERQQMEAAISHAGNANYTLMSGIEAIGHLLFVAANSEENTTDATVLADLGALIRHIAVEAQFLQEQQGDLKATLLQDENRAAPSPLRQKAGAKAAAAESAGAA